MTGKSTPMIGGSSPAARLRRLLHAETPARVIGATSGLAAILAEEAGFDAIWVSSLGLSAGFGLPDVGLLTMTNVLDAATHVCQATELPVIADCDSGFGNALNVAHLVQRFEAAGVAGVCIEDQIFPKINSMAPVGHRLVDATEFAHRIRAGKAAQRTAEFCLIARTEGYVASLHAGEVLRRAEMYVDAGADAVFVHSCSDTPEQIEKFLAGWSSRAPVMIAPTTYPDWHVAEAGRAGVSMCIYANHGLRAEVAALRRTYSTILTDGMTKYADDEIASIPEIFALQGMERWLAIDDERDPM